MKRMRTRIGQGIYRDQWGLSATVKVDGTQREKRFPAGTAIRTIRVWQDHMRVALRAAAPRGCRYSFKTDATHYLANVQRMPSYRERERDIGLWIDEFGSRQRNSITTDEIAAVIQQWEREGYAASTLNHRRGASMHLWSRLDGKEVDNPVARIPRYREPRPEPRGLSWTDVDRILAVMPDRGQPVAGQTLDDASKTKARGHGFYRTHAEASETATPGRCVLARVGDQGTRSE